MRRLLDTLVNMDIHNFFYKAICLVVYFCILFIVYLYADSLSSLLLIKKVATWLRDRISHSIEATSYRRFL